MGSMETNVTRGGMSWTNSESLKNVELQLLAGSDFALPSCKRRVLNIKLPQEMEQNLSEEGHFIFINSLVNFANENGIKALGALLKYLDHNKIRGVNQINEDGANNEEFGLISIR